MEPEGGLDRASAPPQSAAVIRMLVVLIVVAGLGLIGVLRPLWRGELPDLPAAEDLATPYGDARFRAACTTALRARVDGDAAWPLGRVAGLCLCLADRIRDGRLDPAGLTEAGSRGATAWLGGIEARLCRPGQGVP